MLGSSSLSSLVATNRWGCDEDRRRSPIAYRVGPLDYHPPVFCNCNKKAALWISWSDDNPGRRYLKCYRARDGGCEFLGWYEGSHDPFVQTLLVDMGNAVWSLKKEKKAMQNALNAVMEKSNELEKEVAEVTKDVFRLEGIEAKKEFVDGKLSKVQLERNLLRALVAVLVAACGAMWFR